MDDRNYINHNIKIMKLSITEIFLIIFLILLVSKINDCYSSEIPLDIYRAMGKIESNCGDPLYLKGDDGKSLGYFQVKLSTAKGIIKGTTKKDLFDNKKNYSFARTYLEQGFEKYGSIERALIRYNAGETVADKVKERNLKRCRSWVDNNNKKRRSAGCYVKKIFEYIKNNNLCDLSDIV